VPVTLILSVVAWGLIPGLVRLAYADRLPAGLGGVLAGRDIHPVEFYLELAVRPRAILVGALALVGVGLLALSRSTLRSIAWAATTGGEAGWAGLWRPSVAAIVVLAAGLRLFDLGGTSLWLDEAYIANISASGSLATILEQMARESSAAPLHHLLQALLHALGIWGTAAARLPAALAGLTAVIVLLWTSRWGVPRPAAAFAAFVLAVTPLQVDFSRDATQYGVAVLMGTVLLAVGVRLSAVGSHATRRHHVLLAGAFVATPWVAYSVVPTLPAFAVALLLTAGLGSGPSARDLRRTLWLTGAGVLASGALVHRVVAARQLRVRNNWYLEPHYPASSGLSWPEWTMRAVDGHFGMVAGGPALGRLLLVVLALGALLAVTTGPGDRRTSVPGDDSAARFLLLAAAMLLAGAIAAATLRVYPFGPIHQQLHLAPTFLLAGAVMAMRVLARIPRPARWSVLTIVLGAVVLASISNMPSAFAEKEDIVSVVRVGIDDRPGRGLPGVEDRMVWVYTAGRPAVRFHFPARAFTESRIDPTDTVGMADEIATLVVDRRVTLLFSQILPHPTEGDQRRALQTYLVQQGWTVEEEIHFTNTVVLNLIAP
jgi:hypothetical protein